MVSMPEKQKGRKQKVEMLALNISAFCLLLSAFRGGSPREEAGHNAVVTSDLRSSFSISIARGYKTLFSRCM